MKEERIEYTSEAGYTGFLYDWHYDPFCGWHYCMIIRDAAGKNVLHSYNARPKSLEELKSVVDRQPELWELLKQEMEEKPYHQTQSTRGVTE